MNKTLLLRAPHLCIRNVCIKPARMCGNVSESAHVTLYFLFFSPSTIAQFEEKQAAGTTSSFPIMKPDSRLEPTYSLLNCTYTQKHSAVSTFGLVCFGSSLSMWAKGHSPALWLCQEFLFSFFSLSLSFSLSLVS